MSNVNSKPLPPPRTSSQVTIKTGGKEKKQLTKSASSTRGVSDGWVTLDRTALMKFVSEAQFESDSEDDGKATVAGLKDEKNPNGGSSVKMKLGALLSVKGGKGMSFRTVLHYGAPLYTNTTAGKYLVGWGGGSTTQFTVSNIQNGGEWTSFNSVFEEFFVHKMVIRFQPTNQFLGNYVNATSTNIQSSALTLASYQHDQGVVSDGSTNFYQMLNSPQSKFAHTGRPWSFSWVNIEKFTKDGTVGDATTSQHSQAWLNMADVGKYGGYVSGALPYPTSATPSPTAFPETYQIGAFVVDFDVSFRYRD